MHLSTLNTIVNICHSGNVVLNIWLKYKVDVIRSQMCWCPKNTHKESCAWKTQWSVCLKTHWKMCLKKTMNLCLKNTENHVIEKHKVSCAWKSPAFMLLLWTMLTRHAYTETVWNISNLCFSTPLCIQWWFRFYPNSLIGKQITLKGLVAPIIKLS